MMKKSIFAVAVASVLTLGAAQAETVLYGSIRYDYENKKVEEALGVDAHNNLIVSKGKSLSNLNDAGSRIGIKGSEDLGNNNAVIYNLEWGFDGMEANTSGSSAGGFENRLAILGLTGDWGTFTAGRQNNPFKVTIVDDSVQDGFNGGNVITNASQRAMSTTLTGGDTVTRALASRVGKVMAYTSPDFAGFQANVALMMNSDLYSSAEYPAAGSNKEKNIDLWTINAKYAYDLGANGQILAKAGYIQGKLADNNKSKSWGLFLGYLSDSIKVTASYADGNHKQYNADPVTHANGPKEKSKGWDLGASYSFGPNYFSTVRATYGENQLKVEDDKAKVKSWAVGFEQKLSTRTRAWVEYGNQEEKFKGLSGKVKNHVVSVGMRHDF